MLLFRLWKDIEIGRYIDFMKNTKLFLCMICLLLSACEKKEKLEGERFDFLSSSNNNLNIIKNRIANIKGVNNNVGYIPCHIYSGGNAQHDAINYSFSQNYEKLWDIDVGYGPIKSNMIIENKKIYIVDSRGVLRCIDSKNGNTEWDIVVSHQKGENRFSGGIASNDKYIVVCSNLGEVVVVDKKMRKEILRHDIKFPIKNTPIIYKDSVIVLTINNKVFSLDLNKKKINWQHSGNEEETIMEGANSPGLYRDNIIFSYTDGNINSLNIKDGSENWTDVLFSGDTSQSGFIISNIVSDPVIHNNMLIVSNTESKTVLFDVESGIRIWENSIGTFNTPVIFEDYLFMFTNDGEIVCISMKDGSIVWHNPIKDNNQKLLIKKNKVYGPMIINGKITLFGSKGDVFIVEPRDGKIIKTFNIGCSISNTPIIVDKIMYILNERAELYAFK